MSETDLHDFYRRYIAVLNARQFDTLDDLIHAEVTLNGTPATRQQIVAVLQEEVEAVPDLHWEVTDLIVDGAPSARSWSTPARRSARSSASRPPAPRSKSPSTPSTRSMTAAVSTWRRSTMPHRCASNWRSNERRPGSGDENHRWSAEYHRWGPESDRWSSECQ